MQDYAIEIDYRGEMLIYREPGRQANMTCTWGPHPILMRSSLVGWQCPAAGRPMTTGERQRVLDRFIAHLQQQGMVRIEFED